MANKEHLSILAQGLQAWNHWREDHREIAPDLSGAELIKAEFVGFDLSGANLHKVNLYWANLFSTNFSRSDLSKANLQGTNLYQTILEGANLEGATLTHAVLNETNLRKANLTNCKIHGIAAWKVQLEGANQLNLLITPYGEPAITVDNLEVAQFIYLLLHNEKIRNVLDTIGEKGVLILGRFTGERKAVLDAIRERLRALGFVPMMFDFERPTQRDFTETIKTLAGLSRFIIADITNPKSSPLELQATMPDYMIPFVPIIHESEEPFAMFRDLKTKYGEWVLDILKYDTTDNLLKCLDKAVVTPALEMSQKLLLQKAEAIRDRHVRDYM